MDHACSTSLPCILPRSLHHSITTQDADLLTYSILRPISAHRPSPPKHLRAPTNHTPEKDAKLNASDLVCVPTTVFAGSKLRSTLYPGYSSSSCAHWLFLGLERAGWSTEWGRRACLSGGRPGQGLYERFWFLDWCVGGCVGAVWRSRSTAWYTGACFVCVF
jgi:hypothetical protein